MNSKFRFGVKWQQLNTGVAAEPLQVSATGCDWVGKVIWGMGFPFKFAVGAVRHSGRQDNSSPFTRIEDSLWGQETQIQARAPLHQHHMSKTWSLLQCSACLFCLEVFFFFGGAGFEKLSEVQDIEYPPDIYPSFHLFDTITETSQLVHQQVRPKPNPLQFWPAKSHTSRVSYTLLCQTHSAQQQLPPLITHPIFPAAFFMGFHDKSRAGALQLGRVGSQGSNVICWNKLEMCWNKFVLAVSYSFRLLDLSLCMCSTGMRTSITLLTESHTLSHIKVEGLNNSQIPVINFSCVLESCSTDIQLPFQTGHVKRI